MTGAGMGAWPALRDADRDLALALLFAQGRSREILADRLNLALECEVAIRAASEPMLAAIRLQWWVEAIETGRHEQVPLMQRLWHRIEIGEADAASLTDQIGIWQDRLASNPEDAGSCWAGCFALLAPGRDEAASATARCLFGDGSPPSTSAMAELARPETRWLWMLARMARHRQDGTTRDDPLLVWRMLGWRLFG